MHLNRANVNAVWPAICLLTGIFVGSEVAGDPCVPTWETAVGTPGMDGPVLALKTFDDGTGLALYAGGEFQQVGNENISVVARWDGQDWEPVVGIDQSHVRTLVWDFEVFDDGTGPALYAATAFELPDGNGTAAVTKWDGQRWTLVGAANRTVATLRVYDDGGGPELYAGGAFTLMDGLPVNHLAKWDGHQWSDVGGGVSAGALTPVLDMIVFDDGTGQGLYVAGWYVMAGNVTANSIARWDGENWQSLGTGLGGSPNYCQALGVFDDGFGTALYASGAFQSAGGLPARRVANWNGETWGAVGSGVRTTGLDMTVFDDGTGSGRALFMCGFFTEADGLTVNRIAKWDGQQWYGLNSTLNYEAYAFAVFDDGLGESLFIGGQFMIDGGAPGNRITQYRSCINGDFDLDRDVDMSDFKEFAQCFGGARQPPSAACTPGIDADFDGDGDVDVRDYAVFAQNFTGSR